MINLNAYKNCSEFYEVAKTVEFVMPHNGEDTQFRIEALQDLRAGNFQTKVYYQEHFRLQPSFPIINGSFTKNPTDFRVWVPFPNAPWTNRDTANEAITQALGFLGAN